MRIPVMGHVAVALGFTLAIAAPSAAASCDELEAAKRTAYGFRPSQLSPEQKGAKVRSLDAFWALVKAGGPDAVDCLRSMIRADSSDGYFAFNASSLLASLDRSPDSLAVVELGLARTNLDEIDVAAYIRMVVGLIHLHRDVERLGQKYLRHPKVDTRIAQHGGMLLDRDGGGVIIYGSLPTATADRYLAAALRFPEPYARATAAKLLALNLTAQALRALKTFPWMSLKPADRKIIEQFVKRRPSAAAASGTKPRRDVLAALARIPTYGEAFSGFASDEELVASGIRSLEARDLDSLRDARRRSITGISDEALGEYFAITEVILGVINRLDLYRDLRQP
jgi:hypothetical protein